MKEIKIKQLPLIIIVSLLSSFASIQNVDANAFCALRDPVNTIRVLFPEATHHRSVVKAVNSDARDQISDVLPFTLHFNELGKHTLYLIEDDNRTIGYAHVRSELTKWGLVEIAWGLKPDLTIRNVRFQRCRIPDCEGKHLENILELTAGKSYGDLIRLFNKDGQSFIPEIAKKIRDSSEADFALAAIKSAIKTIAVTSITWQQNVADINRGLLLQGLFDVDENISLNAISIPKNRYVELDKALGGGGSLIDRSSAKAFEVTGKGQRLGTIVTANWRYMKFKGMFNWLFDTNGKIMAIQPFPKWPDAEISQSFENLYGTLIENEEQCNNAAESVAYELYYLSHIGVDVN